MFRWIERLKESRKRATRRAYYARREAEAMRMQHGRAAESRCASELDSDKLSFRRRRFLLLVQKALEEV